MLIASCCLLIIFSKSDFIAVYFFNFVLLKFEVEFLISTELIIA